MVSTHDVFNQSTPFVDFDLYDTGAALTRRARAA